MITKSRFGWAGPGFSLARRLRGDRAGNVVLMFSLVALPLIYLVGAGVDYGFSLKVKADAQNVLDAAVLAGGSKLNLVSDAEVEETVRAFIDKNAKDYSFEGAIVVEEVEIGASDGWIRADAVTSVPTSFMRLVGIDRVYMNISSQAQIGNQSFEVGLVLDNSGSMQGTKIVDLRTAAANLTDILFGTRATSPKVSIGVVPFAGLVNVGTGNAGAAWMDTGGLSSLHKSIYSGTKTRFELYDDMNVDWLGCVEARPGSFASDDTEASAGDPDTLIVPSFAPDEPDGNGAYYNSYLDDNGGGCAAASEIDSDACSDPLAVSCEQRQKKTCKYDGASADTSLFSGTRKGPNFLCDSKPVTPLTNVKSTVVDAVSDMEAYGGTNIHEALAWGWRVLSPGLPFDEGAAYGTPNNNKIMVLMTDGHNDIIDTITHNRSIYSAYGFYADGRLDTGGDTSDEAMEEAMNVKALDVCSNAKAAGIQIYTIAFEVNDEPTLDMLRSCATSPGMAFASSSGADLIETFQQIAQQINKLRLSQ